MRISKIETGVGVVQKNAGIKNNSGAEKEGLKLKNTTLPQDTVSFKSKVVYSESISKNITSQALENIKKFVDLFEDATSSQRYWNRPRDSFSKAINNGFLSWQNFESYHLGSGMAGNTYKVYVDNVLKYVIKEPKKKECNDPVYGPGGLHSEFRNLEQLSNDSKYQAGIAFLKTEDGNHFLVSEFEDGEPVGGKGYNFKEMTRHHVKDSLDILKKLDNDYMFNSDWNIGNIFYKGDGSSSYPKVIDLQWFCSMSDADNMFYFAPNEKRTNMLPFEGGLVATYLSNLYEKTKDVNTARKWLSDYLKIRADYCDTSNNFERLRKVVYQNPTEDVLDAEIMRLALLKNHTHQFLYTDRQNEEERDMLKMVRYQVRANNAAKFLEEFKPQKSESSMSQNEKEYFEEMRKFGESWRNKTKSDYRSSIDWMKKLVSGEVTQTTGLYGTGKYYWSEKFGTKEGDTMIDKTNMTEILSKDATNVYKRKERALKGFLDDLEKTFIKLNKKPVDIYDLKYEIADLTPEVIV